MSISQTDVIDAIGIDNSSGDVVLTITDHLTWGNDEHLLLLQEKLNTYLNFVESGEIINVYKDAKGRDILINVACKHPPDEGAKRFLQQVHSIVESARMKFNYSLFEKPPS